MFHDHRSFSSSRHARAFRRGDLKYVILQLLEEEPRHGYDIIRVMEEQSHGFYSPSPGVVYPTLQLLQEMGYVTGEQQDGKTVYTITDDGREFLATRGKQAERVKKQMAQWWSGVDADAIADALHKYRELGHLVRRNRRRLSPEKLDRIRQIISTAYRDLEETLKED